MEKKLYMMDDALHNIDPQNMGQNKLVKRTQCIWIFDEANAPSIGRRGTAGDAVHLSMWPTPQQTSVQEEGSR